MASHIGELEENGGDLHKLVKSQRTVGKIANNQINEFENQKCPRI